MATDRLTAARQHVHTAQAKLDAALLDGGDTAAARALLTEAEAHLARLIAADRAESDAQTQEQEQERADQAAGLVEQTERALRARVVALLPPDWPAPEVRLPPGLARCLTDAESAHADHDRALAAHRAHAARLEARIADLSARCQTLIERRAAGEGDDRLDAATLALLEADRTHARHLLAAHREQEPELGRPTVTAQREARAAWEQAQREAEANALARAVFQLERHLERIADRLVELAPPGMVGHRYQPSGRMRQAVRQGVW